MIKKVGCKSHLVFHQILAPILSIFRSKMGAKMEPKFYQKSIPAPVGLREASGEQFWTHVGGIFEDFCLFLIIFDTPPTLHVSTFPETCFRHVRFPFFFSYC